MSISQGKESHVSITSPFLLKFLGRVTTVDKHGTLGEKTRPLVDISNTKKKTCVTGHKFNHDNLNNNSILKKKEKTLLIPIKHTSLTSPTTSLEALTQSRSSADFYIDTILPKNLSLEMDFKEMLEKLNAVEGKRRK